MGSSAARDRLTSAALREFLHEHRRTIAFWVVLVPVSGALYVLSRYNYLLFHSLVELGAVMTSGLFFTIAVIMLRQAGHDFLFLLATGFFWSGVIDLVHTLAYKGMGVFPGYTADLPTQLWITARYLESLVILGATVWLGRRLKRWWLPPSGIGVCAVLGIALAFLGILPTAYVEGQGLTQFKILSEYVICGLLAIALGLMWSKRQSLSQWTIWWLTITFVLTIFAELAFTRYVGVYGVANALGHIFKLMAYASMFRIVVRYMLERPMRVLGAIVPVCASCKAVRVSEGRWLGVEQFLATDSGKQVSHGLCPQCCEALVEREGLGEGS